MEPSAQGPGAVGTVVVGLAGLAAAMGIGRFALTPLVPALQAQAGLTLPAVSALAAANYAGYLAGAVLCALVAVSPGALARVGLSAVAVSTLAMGATTGFVPWLAWRFVAGVASAFALIGLSAWALHRLAEQRRAAFAGGVFAGVGVGIALAGLVVLALGALGFPAVVDWSVLGTLAAIAAAFAWRPLRSSRSVVRDTRPGHRLRLRGSDWLLVAAYGAFGFGYIVPATFLPALAARLSEGGAGSGLWALFGAAAAASTLVVSHGLPRVSPRRIWACAQLAMAVAVAAPAVAPGTAALVVTALGVGGTFMVVTMTGMQEARRIGQDHAPRLMAAMTAAFALGQLAGPVVVGALGGEERAFAVPSITAALLLACGAVALIAAPTSPAPRSVTHQETHHGSSQ